MSRGCNVFSSSRIYILMTKIPTIALAFFGLVGTARAVDLETLLIKNTAARGGEAALASVKAYESDIHIVEPQFAVDGTYIATRDGRMRVDIRAEGERVFTEALGRERAWSWDPENGVRGGSADGAAALRHGIELPFKIFGLRDMRERGHRLELAGTETLDGVAYHVLRATLSDGFEVTYYVNPETWLIERDRQRRAMHVDVDPTPEWIETRYEDYRPAAGVLYPFRQVEKRVATGEILSTVTVGEIRINPPLDGARFFPP
jgi:hypothetical protein